jgi:1,6-anhydro-N-acetylmuramate kinase
LADDAEFQLCAIFARAIGRRRPRRAACAVCRLVLLRHETKNRVVCNIGGIANVSLLPANCELEQVRAWDTGPGNMIIDEAARHFFNLPCDPNGSLADGAHEDDGSSTSIEAIRFSHVFRPKRRGVKSLAPFFHPFSIARAGTRQENRTGKRHPKRARVAR